MTWRQSISKGWQPAFHCTQRHFWLAWVVFTFITLIPVLMLFIVDLSSGKTALEISSRTLKLLKNTVGFSILSTVFAIILAIVCGLFLCDRKYAFLRLPFVFLAFLPPYIHAQGFANLVAAPPPGLEFLRHADGIHWAALVCGVSFAPICSMVISTASFSVPASQIESARINLDYWKFFRFTVFPAVWPLIIAGACITFIFSIMEGGLPLSMQTTVFATEIISQFLAGKNFASIFITIWPMFVLIFLAFLSLTAMLNKFACNIGTNRRCSLIQITDLPFIVSFIAHALLILAILVMFLPCLALVKQAFSEGNSIFSKADKDTILPSIGLSFFCAFFCTLICHNISKGKWHNKIFTAILLISAIIPSSITGIAWAWAGSLIPALPQLLILGLSHIARALPPTMIVSVMAWKSFTGWRQLESAELLPQSIFLRLKIESPVILISFCIATITSLRELETTLLTVPAGYQTLPLRVFNLMHYGAGADVARLSLAIALIMALGATTIIKKWPK